MAYLQARPVTTLYQESEWEMIHEFDSPLASDTELMTTANAGYIIMIIYAHFKLAKIMVEWQPLWLNCDLYYRLLWGGV